MEQQALGSGPSRRSTTATRRGGDLGWSAAGVPLVQTDRAAGLTDATADALTELLLDRDPARLWTRENW